MPEGSLPALVDGHVHFHPCYDVGAFLDAAVENLASAALERGLPSEAAAVAMLTEMSGQRFFAEWRDGRELGATGWAVEGTGESCSIVARREDGRRLLLVAGRQIATAERLEVLALATEKELPDGMTLGETLAAVDSAAAIPVIPWGFGKWWFRRGAKVCEVLGGAREGRLFLGDNAGRPRHAPRSRPFALATRMGVPVLPGTDPLALASHCRRIGSYGFLLESGVDLTRPAESVRRGLRLLTGDPPRFGRRETWLGFVSSQIGLRLRPGRAK